MNTRQRRKLAAAVNAPTEGTLDLLFNIDADGHDYGLDLLDLAAATA
jgi:hypothetical protein